MRRSMRWNRRRGEHPYRQHHRPPPPVPTYPVLPAVGHLKLLAFCALVTGATLCACNPAEVSLPVGARITRLPIQVIHYGDDGALAQIEGKAGLYAVIFAPECQGCQLAERAIEPLSVYDKNLCEFRMIVSGEILTPNLQLTGTLKITRVDRQPVAAAGHRKGHHEQSCHRSIKGKP